MEDTQKKISLDEIEAAFIDHVLNEGTRPASVYAFAKKLGTDESELYNYFTSFEHLEQLIVKSHIDHAIASIKSGPEYNGFTTQDKLLTFYYALFGILRNRRSFLLLIWPNQMGLAPWHGKGLRTFTSAFSLFAEELILEGKTNGSIPTRQFIDKGYTELFTANFVFLLNFWKEDKSANFEKTDAAIEKSVDLLFKAVGNGLLDTAFDFAKFVYQNR